MVKVWIDAGHGGQDSGATGNGLQEKEIVVEIARQLNKILVLEYGVDTGMTRQDDTFVSLSERANRANTWGADAFISIHCNSGGGRGFESYRYTGASDSRTTSLQNTVHDAVMAFYRQHSVVDRGKKIANYAVLRETNMIALLTENLFVDNIEILKFEDINFLIGVARAHAEGIAAYFGLQKKVSEIRYIYTGGHAGPGLGQIHDYLFQTGHNFDVKRGSDGSIIFLIGPFDILQPNFNDCKNFLDKNGYSNVLKTPGEAAVWR
ncbi:N-acetylmuramoyl-L-alanine amidase [Ectobacillus sp. JY-23]|uniref:N-acetylmuramoyl-L-alanine amidase family protein n=1 Tax=Ectobacillus sp. JY-23 TaxID=2933872 RepID=UPI001FF1279A|nr:N-acetylmuramoyl-L-alanine amidase [Ectobacillus sp. JY-23]UOY92069.1 N-acetylmuramoyl-L-alanine amidase [Ectobacillus sp. JY-23]